LLRPCGVDKSVDLYKIDNLRFQRYSSGTQTEAFTQRFGPYQQEITMKKLVLETTSPFQGLAELVAYDEGLFTKEGVQVEWADRDEAGVRPPTLRSRM